MAIRDEARSVAISPDGRTLASGGQDHLVMLWSREAAEAGNTVETNLYLSPLDPVFSADGRWLATINTNPAVVIVDLEQRRVAQTFCRRWVCRQRVCPSALIPTRKP